jgi:hypothetical protein
MKARVTRGVNVNRAALHELTESDGLYLVRVDGHCISYIERAIPENQAALREIVAENGRCIVCADSKRIVKLTRVPRERTIQEIMEEEKLAAKELQS